MGCTPMTQKWRSEWRAATAECASNICAAINKEKSLEAYIASSDFFNYVLGAKALIA